MTFRRAAVALAALMALGACARTTPAPAAETTQAIPDFARVVCDSGGTRLLGDQVREQPDGVHVVVDNRLGEDAGFVWDGGGDNAPMGVHELVFAEAPGTAHVGCHRNEDGGGDRSGFVALDIVDPEGVYR